MTALQAPSQAGTSARQRSVRSPLSPRSAPEQPVIPLSSLTRGYVTGVVSGQDSQAEESRVSQANDYLHLSSLINACPRMHVLAHRYEVTIHNFVSGAHRVMWAMGRAAEHHIRTSFIRGVNWQGVYGRWRCVCGKRRVEGFLPTGGPRAALCASCGSGCELYEEMAWRDEAAKIVGNPDLTFQTRDGLAVVEIKSMNGDEYEALIAPKPDHVLQALGYRRLIQSAGIAVAPSVVIIYVNKKFQFRGGIYKEFLASESEATTPALDMMWGAARAIQAGKQAGANVIPVRLPACTSSGTTVAKRCPTCTYCFSIA